METKVCSRCGIEKPIAEFREYYTVSGTYKYCKECEKIEARRKYLIRKGDAITDAQREELDRIGILYERRRSKGLEAPTDSSSVSVNDLLDKYLNEE